MRAMWTTGLVLLLTGLWAGARAEEFAWRPAASAAPPAPVASSPLAVSLGSPIAVGATTPRPADTTGPSLAYKARAANSEATYLPPTLPVWGTYSPARTPAAKATFATSTSPSAGSNPGVLPTSYTKPAPTTATPSVVSVSSKPQWGEWATEDGCVCTGESMTKESDRFYVRGEYLLWTIRDSRFPVLATTGPASSDAILGRPGVVPLFGGGSVDNEARSGARFTAGYWFDACQKCGIEGSFFFLGDRAVRFDADSAQFPVISRPFFNTATGMEDVEQTAFPGQQTGHLSVKSSSKLWGADVNLRHNLCCGCWYRVDLLGGFRYLDLDEGVTITESGHFSPNFSNLFPGTNLERFNNANFLVVDQFGTHNQFYGAQVGANAQFQRGNWSLDLLGKVAIGQTRQVVNIAGLEIIDSPLAGRLSFPGGLLAQSTNSGHHSRERFSVVPEVGVTVGYQLTDQVKLFAGYNFLFWSNVARPGDHIDRNLNPRNVPILCQVNPSVCPPGAINVPRPFFEFKETSFWAQGITCGLEYKF
jgi:hypothetical protein